jgi:hypothetical protein
MSLTNVISLLQNSEYHPKSALLANYEELTSVVSASTHAFFHMIKIASGSDDEPYLIQSDLNFRWSDYEDIMQHYRNMDSKHRAEALGVICFFVHECTHHVDHLITPYGAAFHLANLQEYLSFKTLASRLLQVPDYVSNQPLFQLPRSLCTDQIYSAWSDLAQVTVPLDAWQRTWATKITEGWGGEKRLFELMAGPVEAVTVNNFFYTVRRAGSSIYLGPVAILETRALVHSLCWILFTLGYDHSVDQVQAHRGNHLKQDLLLFMNTYYRKERLRPEYRFLLDLFSRLWGQKSFEELIENMTVQYLFAALILIDGLCWYSLHSAPLGCDVHAINKSPAGRLILAMIYFEDLLRVRTSKGEKLRFDSTVEMLTELDKSDYARKYNLLPVYDCLRATLNEIRRSSPHNFGEFSVALRDHYHHLHSIQGQQMNIRLNHGYNSLLGLPETGNPAYGVCHYVSNQSEARDLLVGL